MKDEQSQKFLLDSNIFIQAALNEYRFGFCGGFWRVVQELHKKEIIYSINAVKEELTQKDDELSQWVKRLPASFFLSHEDSISEYAKLMNWAYGSSHFNDGAKKKFASDHADPWLVAYAAKHNMTIITHETYQPERKNAIKIPVAARHLSVKYDRLFDFLENC